MLETAALRQPSFPDLCPITAAIEGLAEAENIEARGAFFTRREVVDFILDLAGYTTSKPLHTLCLLEPSFGNGDFLLPAIERLFAAWRASDVQGDPVKALAGAIRAVELHRDTFANTSQRISSFLVDLGLSSKDAKTLTGEWLVHGDFLLVDLPGTYDFVMGNPPYVRQELIPDVLLAEYRARYVTLYDRADLYIPFIERSLSLLSKGGHLGFICADRWMKNRYGGPLRALVAREFHLKFCVDMVDTPAFHSDVIAYPAIIVISRESPGATRLAFRPDIDRKALTALAAELQATKVSSKSAVVRELSGVIAGAEPWIFEADDQIALVRRLESSFPTLEEAACKVGIGVATGADKEFIGPFDQLDVEADRKLPLVTTKDILNGVVEWQGLGVINPFADERGLVNLRQYPKLKRYLEHRKTAIAKRHCAQKTPENWYRTIDRITPALAAKPKLLIPDIKGEASIVYEAGGLYPHHNLYFITSDAWDLRALQAVLLSGIAHLFVSAYSTKMRGGFLRFQAQYLRRIRVPHWQSVPAELRRRLVRAGETGNNDARHRAVAQLYSLTVEESDLIKQNGQINGA
ncbi:TaqI-like C-terminal specificity domain-containing protein [Paraburkholderia dipogonis]|uniref:site-specific DNA-methyltransferase (adenine-specific) n=1 Tax=Paraburkholderia dipogonis TaxID=1211383 RepID=A0ABW9AYS7_9BURK